MEQQNNKSLSKHPFNAEINNDNTQANILKRQKHFNHRKILVQQVYGTVKNFKLMQLIYFFSKRLIS